MQQILRTVASGETVIDPKVVSHIVHQSREENGERMAERGRDDVALTAQQLTILRLISQGFSNREVGTQMFLSEKTVKSYVQDLLQKMRVHNRTEAAMVASKKGWI